MKYTWYYYYNLTALPLGLKFWGTTEWYKYKIAPIGCSFIMSYYGNIFVLKDADILYKLRIMR